MPIHREGSGWQWGNHGKVYSSRAGAERQAAAAHANGYRGDSRISRDTSKRDFANILNGLFKFFSEEVEEPEHQEANDEQPTQAAGVMCRHGDKLLFMRRKDTGDWAFPGGVREDGEDDPRATALREMHEETGHKISDAENCRPLHRHTLNGVDFATHLYDCSDEFEPKLNDEHSEYRWATRDDAPKPMHPGVQRVLEDASQEALSKRIKREYERGHTAPGQAAAIAYKELGESHDARRAHDAVVIALDHGNKDDIAFTVAMDKSARSYDADGRLHVEKSNISKANICEYRGDEIPDFEQLGLDPKKMYRLLRDPNEIERATKTFNNLPILSKHVPVSADDHPHELVIGATGSEAKFDHPYLTNSLVFWPRKSIDKIEDEDEKELSSAYRYRADMTQGNHEGEPYDGVMRDIIGNHVALVKKGRAGPDVVVGDAHPTEEKEMRLFPGALILKSALVTKYPKLIAMDSQVNSAIKHVRATEWDKQKKALAPILHGLLAGIAQDASLEHVHSFLDSLDKPEHEAKDAENYNNMIEGEPTPDADPDKEEEEEGEDESEEEREEAEKASDAAEAERREEEGEDAENEEEKEERHEKEAGDRKRARDAKRAKDAAKRRRAHDRRARGAHDKPPPFEGEPETGAKDKMSRKAMDEAIQVAVKAERKRQNDVQAARSYVHPWVGALDGAFESSDEVYGKALQLLGRDIKNMPPAAFKYVLDATPKPGVVLANDSMSMATDSAGAKSFFDRFPGADKITIN